MRISDWSSDVCSSDLMELLRVTPEIRDRLHRRRTGADDRNPLIGQAVEFRLLPAAAGVVVVPTRGVEDLALERRQSGNARQLRPVQRTAAHDTETCPDVVAAIGDDLPAADTLAPAPGFDHRVKTTG